MRLLAFDVDYTLAAANRPILPSTVELLREFQRRGVRIMLLSGKPVSYLAGLGRQLGLDDDLVLAGENGAAIISSHAFPPMWQRVEQPAEDVRLALDRFVRQAGERFGERIWFQPNMVNVSVFWREPADKDEVTEFAREFVEHVGTDAVRIYEHVDAVELTVPDADKGTALTWVAGRLQIPMTDVVAVGDSSNDLPMFEVAGLSVGVAFDKGDKNFDDIDSALRSLADTNGED